MKDRTNPGQEMTSESSSTQTVATWQVRRTQLPPIQRRCLPCGSNTFKAAGKFRINANGKLLDVWLLLHCTHCDRTAKATVIERSASIDLNLLRRFEKNDADLVAEVLFDPAVARRNRYTLDWEGSWEIISDPDEPCAQYPCSVSVTFADPIPLRPAELIAHGLGVSRSKVKQMIDNELIKLSAKQGVKTSTPFEFTILETPTREPAPESAPREQFIARGRRYSSSRVPR